MRIQVGATPGATKGFRRFGRVRPAIATGYEGEEYATEVTLRSRLARVWYRWREAVGERDKLASATPPKVLRSE